MKLEIHEMKKKIIISVAAFAGLASLLAGWFVVWPSAPSYAAGAIYRQAHFDGDREQYRHQGKHRGHRSVARLCSDRRDHSIKTVTGFVEGFVNLTPEQTGPWNELTQAVTESSARIGKACDEIDLKAKNQITPEKLAQIERMLETGLSVVKNLRPAVTNFYAVLSADQKKALDGLTARRHGNNFR